MRNEAMSELAVLSGQWRTTMGDAWFLEDGLEVPGVASGEWLHDSLLVLRWQNQGGVGDATSDMVVVIGRSDAQDSFTALYHDERGVCRVFAMTFGDGRWALEREDPDMFQRFVAEVGSDRIVGRWEASEDRGTTWRKDFDLVFDRVS